MIVQLLTEHHFEFLSLEGGCKGSPKSTHVKVPHCWKSHVRAHLSSLFKFQAIGTLEQMTEAMEPPTRDGHETTMEEEERGPSSTGSRTLTPQPSARSPTRSARATGRSTARSKKSTVEDKHIL